MSNRRSFLAAGGALTALSTLPTAKADQHVESLYLHGLVWNRQLPDPMKDWLIRFDAKVDVPLGNGIVAPSAPGFATFGDDIHDGINSHVEIRTATVKGDQLTIAGVISQSKTPGMVGEAVRIEGKIVGTAVQGLTVTLGATSFTGAGLLVRIAIIAILIGL